METLSALLWLVTGGFASQMAKRISHHVSNEFDYSHNGQSGSDIKMCIAE